MHKHFDFPINLLCMRMTDFKTIMGIIPVIISAGNLVYYLYTVYYGNTRPHLFSYLIWAIVAGIAAAGQIAKGAGSGAWITIAIAIFCIIRVFASITHGEKHIAYSDWVCLLACLAAIAVWVLMDDPSVSVVIVTFIDAAGIYPTARKSWAKPHEENVLSYFLFGLVSFLSLWAIKDYNFTTVVYPAVVTVICWGFSLFLFWRRRALPVMA